MLLETASFRGDDDPALVRAALACSLCLSGAVDWTLDEAEWDAHVVCTCRDCGHRRLVALNTEQTLRLYLVRSRERPREPCRR